MGASASVIDAGVWALLARERDRPADASDLSDLDAARAEVARLRGLWWRAWGAIPRART